MSRYRTPAKLPSQKETELLIVLMEEAFECLDHLGVRASKALRFGLDEVQPGQEHTNAARLGVEYGQLSRIMEELVVIGVIDDRDISRGHAEKSDKMREFLQFQEGNEQDPDLIDPHAFDVESFEVAAKIAEAEADTMAKLGTEHAKKGNEDATDRCYARARSSRTIADAIRQHAREVCK